MGSHRTKLVVAVALTVTALLAGRAVLGWIALEGRGSVSIPTDTLHAPTGLVAEVAGRDVTVRFPAVRFADDTPASGYTLFRVAETGVSTTTPCDAPAGDQAACRDSDVPPGTWSYRALAAHEDWTSVPSEPTDPVVVAPPTAGLSVSSVTAAGADGIVRLTGFPSRATVTLSLDGDAGRPVAPAAPVPPGGALDVDVAIPSGLTPGPHAITVTSSGGDIATAPFSVEGTALRPENRPPAAVTDRAVTASSTSVVVDVLANDTDPDGDVLSLTSVADPAHGTAVTEPGNAVRYTPDAGFTGVETVSYVVTDPQGARATGDVEIFVAARQVERVVPPGEPVPITEAATATNPVALTITSPTGGSVQVAEARATTPMPGGFETVGTTLLIEAPPASAGDPLRLSFRVDVSGLGLTGEALDEAVRSLSVRRNGEVAADCPGSAVADPDPCVTDRRYDRSAQDVILVVLAAHASVWDFGLRTDAVTRAKGYRMVDETGRVVTFGDVPFFGDLRDRNLKKPIVGMAATPGGKGYWLVAADGGIFAFGDAAFFGSTGNLKLNRPIVGMAPTPTGEGYWLAASDGGIFAFGDARFFGSTGNLKLNRPIVGMAAGPRGEGYWLVASDGGIFAFGNAPFDGSAGDLKLNRPIVGMAATRGAKGYWLVASDGGIFAFGDAAHHGSTAHLQLKPPIVGMAATPSGDGYWLVTADGRIFSFGDAPDHGGRQPAGPVHPVVAIL